MFLYKILNLFTIHSINLCVNYTFYIQNYMVYENKHKHLTF